MTHLHLDDFRRQARRRLPKAVFDYLEGGADSERGLRRNREAFETILFRPARLVDVARRDLSTELLGERRPLPLAIAPTGLNGVLWPKGDVILARAAARFGIPFILSTASTSTIEEVAAEAGGELWFQLYVVHRELARDMAMRAWNAGYKVLVLTTDVAVNGKRLRDMRSGFKIPFERRPGILADMIAHPGWLYRQFRHGLPRLANFATSEATSLEVQAALMARKMDASFGWDDLKHLRDLWPGKLLVKGLSRAEDARCCVELGCDGVVLSNHGGRQLEDIVAPIAALATEDMDVDRPVLVDSGIRDGADVVKALALGAASVLVGRPVLYGLAAAGEEGVAGVLDMFKTDIDRTLALIGAPSVDSLDRSFIAQDRKPV